MHSWILINTTELRLPFQSDPLVRGSLSIRTVCRLVVYFIHILFCPVTRPVPSHLVWLGLLFCLALLLLFCLLLSSCMTEKGWAQCGLTNHDIFWYSCKFCFSYCSSTVLNSWLSFMLKLVLLRISLWIFVFSISTLFKHCFRSYDLFWIQ